MQTFFYCSLRLVFRRVTKIWRKSFLTLALSRVAISRETTAKVISHFSLFPTLPMLSGTYFSQGAAEKNLELSMLGKRRFQMHFHANYYSNSRARQAACAMAIQLHCRVLRVSPADSWHQPDSPENCRKFLSNKDICDEKPQEEGDNDDAPIHILNDDCLTEIFLCLPIADRIRMERGNRVERSSNRCSIKF